VAYGDLEALSGRIARALVAAGCARGDRVAAQVEKSWEAVALYLGCLRAGLVFLPLNTGYQRGELAYFFGNAEPRAIVTRAASVAMTREVAPAGSTVFTLEDDGTGTLLDAARSEPADFDTVVSAPGDLAAILYTSGTTGRSKGAMLSHANLAANARVLVDFWGFTAGDVLLHALPIYHVHGLFVATHCALLSGSRMIFLRRFEPRPVIARLPRSTVMMGVPTFYTRLLADPAFGRECCTGVRLFVSGSAPLLAETFAEFERRTGQRILERYGMTETGMNTSNPLAGERIAGTVGPPLPGVSVRIVGEGGAECPPGTIGDIQVRGENVFGGYWRMPEKNVEEYTADGWFRTGDTGIRERGSYRVMGRSSVDIIKSGGYKLSALEIENVLLEHPAIRECAVLGLPDEIWGEVVAAAVVLREHAALDVVQLRAWCAGRLSPYKQPRRLLAVAALPRNAMGKVVTPEVRGLFDLQVGLQPDNTRVSG
jgi:malonyl-CoA/methylmalonyl-CoA synthetase